MEALPRKTAFSISPRVDLCLLLFNLYQGDSGPPRLAWVNISVMRLYADGRPG